MNGIEQIDIGGPTMVRAAAKNYLSGVTAIVDPQDYASVLDRLKTGEIPLSVRRELSAKAFKKTADYEIMISKYFT